MGISGIDMIDVIMANSHADQEIKKAVQGRGIADLNIVDGELIVTYTDGTIESAGEIPSVFDAISVLSFGAVGDGTTDNSQAIKAAFEEAITVGKPLYIPEGEFLIDWGKINLDLDEKGLVVFGDGRTKSIIKLKDSQNGGNGGSGIALRNTDSTIAPNVSISDIGMVYENNDDSALIYSGQARQINMLGYFGEVSIDNSYFHLGGTAETLPQDSCLFWSLGADTITITNCLFENFTNREVGGCVWIMPSDAENTYSIGQVIIKNNEFRNTNKDEAVAVYTSVADIQNNIHNIIISGNVITHKSWNSTQGNCFYTDGLITVLIANASSPKNDGNVVISDNNLYSELASQEIIRITRFKGVEVRNNKLTVTAKNGSSNLRTIRFIQSDGVIKDNVLDYTEITENEVQADNGSDSKVSWENNRFMLGTGGGINPSSNTTFVFKGNVVDIPNNKKFAIRKNQSTNTVEVYDNTINGNLSMGALNGSGLVIKGNRFNANVATTNSVDVSGGTGAYLDYQGNDGVVLQFKTGNVQTPISKFTYVGRKGQLKFLSGSTPLDDSSETRALFFSTADIVYTDKQVEANPTLVGTEPVLDGIEIGGNKFKNVSTINPDAKGAVGDGTTDDSSAFVEDDYIYQLTDGKTYKITKNKLLAISDNGVEGLGRIRYINDNYYDDHIYGNNTRLLPTYGKHIFDKSAVKPKNRFEECVGWLSKARTYNTETLGRNFKTQGIKRPDNEAGNYLPIGAIYYDYDKANALPDQFTICFGKMTTLQRKNGETEWTITNSSVPATNGIKNYALPWTPEYSRDFNHTPTVVGDHVELIIDKEELTSWQGSQSGKTEGIVHFWGKAHVFEANEYDDVIVCQELWVKEAEASNLLQFVVALDIRSNDGAETPYMAQSIFQPQMPIPSTPERFWTCTMNIDDARTVNFESITTQMYESQYGVLEDGAGRNYNLLGFEDCEVVNSPYTVTFDEDTGILQFSTDGTPSWKSISLTSHLKAPVPIRLGDKFRLNFQFIEPASSTYIGSIYYANNASMSTGSGLVDKGNGTYTKLFTAEADFVSFTIGLNANLNYKIRMWITKGEEYIPYQKYGEQIKGYVLNDNVIDKNLQDRINALDVKVPDVYPTDGTYTLKATVADGAITYSWVADE